MKRKHRTCFPFAKMILAMGLIGLAGAHAQEKVKWMNLFNGKNLAGWRYNSNLWKAAPESSMIIGKGHTDYNTFCVTGRIFKDFELAIRGRLWEVNPWYTNSGVMYRAQYFGDTAQHKLKGYQLDIGDGVAATMYPEQGFPNTNGQGSTAACRAAMKKNEFNQYLITANARHITQKLAGNTCNDWTSDPQADSGYVGLQIHFPVNAPQGTMQVDFKDIFIRPLNNSFAIPDSQAVYLNADYTLAGTVAVLDAGGAPQVTPMLLGNRLVTGFPAWTKGAARITLTDARGRITFDRAYASGRIPAEINLPAGLRGIGYLKLSVNGKTSWSGMRLLGT